MSSWPRREKSWPRTRAALSPATVRSRISSRSNSASAAKMPNTKRPAAVVVSICAPSPASTRRPTPRADRSCTVLTQMGEVAAEAVRASRRQDVALAQGAQAAVETCSATPCGRPASTRSTSTTSGWRGRAATATSERRCCRLPPSLMPTAACRSRPVRTIGSPSAGSPWTMACAGWPPRPGPVRSLARASKRACSASRGRKPPCRTGPLTWSPTSSVSRTHEFELDDLADAAARDRLKWACSRMVSRIGGLAGDARAAARGGPRSRPSAAGTGPRTLTASHCRPTPPDMESRRPRTAGVTKQPHSARRESSLSWDRTARSPRGVVRTHRERSSRYAARTTRQDQPPQSGGEDSAAFR